MREAGTYVIVANGPHREYVTVSFLQQPQGSAVSKVSVNIPEEAITATALRAQVRAKYGEPQSVRNDGTALMWCAPEHVRACGSSFSADGRRPEQAPHLRITSNPTGGGWIWLEGGSDAEADLERRMTAEVERLAPKTEQAAF